MRVHRRWTEVLRRFRRREQASVTLEAAISMSMFFLFLMAQLLLIKALDRERQFVAAGRRTAEELTLLEASFAQTDMDSKDSGAEETGKGIRGKSGSLAQPFVLGLAKERFRHWRDRLPDIAVSTALSCDARLRMLRREGRDGRLRLTYRLRGIWGDAPRMQDFWICSYATGAGERGGREEADKAVNPWSLGNFSRAAYFRERYSEAGVSAEQDFRSMDLCRDYYRDGKHIQAELRREREQALSQSGAVSGAMADKMPLTLIIPENSPEERLRLLEDCADELGLVLDIRATGVSPYGEEIRNGSP